MSTLGTRGPTDQLTGQYDPDATTAPSRTSCLTLVLSCLVAVPLHLAWTWLQLWALDQLGWLPF